jgi:hypothetical protein
MYRLPRDAPKLMAERERARTLPTRTVTREQFIAAMRARGASLAEARLQAKIAAALGSEVVAGNERLRIAPAVTGPAAGKE